MFHGSEVTLKGAYLAQVPTLLAANDYRCKQTTTVSNKELKSILGDYGRSIVVAYEEEGWTHLFDPELTLPENEEAWKDSTQSQSTRAIGWIAESASSTLAFWNYEAGDLRRMVLTVDGSLDEKGARLPEEVSIVWEEASTLDLFAFLERLGIPYRQMRSDLKYHVFDVV